MMIMHPVGCHCVSCIARIATPPILMQRTAGPTRQQTTSNSRPMDHKERKGTPIFRGVLMYFPRALVAVAQCSVAGNEQHHPGQPLHWDKNKSTDEADALVRHLMASGTLDTDGIRHSAKVAWRALALLEREIEGEQNANLGKESNS